MGYLRDLHRLICTPDLDEKVDGPSRLVSGLSEAVIQKARREGWHGPVPVPGRPAGMGLASPRDTARPHDFSTPEGRSRLLHAVAQIELCAVELALDSSLSFPEAPFEYHREMLALAAEEAGHFRMLRRRLEETGHRFGDFPVHGNLWSQARQAEGLIERMAIVPRILEARGLDATPALIVRFQRAADGRTAALLEAIYREEIGHVAAGGRWFRRFALKSGRDPDDCFAQIVERFHRRNGRGRYAANLGARRQAGFSEKELSLFA